MHENYQISEFVENLLDITHQSRGEEEVLSRIGPLVSRFAAQSHWRSKELYIADEELGFGSTLLHAEDDHSLFIAVDSWLPGRGVRPHDHGTWAVVVGLEGTELNTFWERIDDGSKEGHAELIRLSEKPISGGDIVTMRSGEIHSVINETDKTTLSFHVYGRHLNYTGRSQFDVENNLELPFLIATR